MMRLQELLHILQVHTQILSDREAAGTSTFLWEEIFHLF